MGLWRWLTPLKAWQERRDARERELEAEIQSQLALEVQANVERGLSLEEAEYAARRAFGNAALVMEDTRGVSRSGVRWVEDFAGDLKYGIRGLARSPQLLLAAMLSLGLAVGVNTTIFSIFRAISGKEVTATEPDRLMRVKFGPGTTAIQVSYSDFKEFRRAGAFAGLAGFSSGGPANWRMDDETRRLETLGVTANFFELLGVRAGLGRVFTTEEGQAEQDPRIAVISYGFWRQLGADPSMVGRAVTINGQPFTVIGVLPKQYRPVTMLALDPCLYVPLSTAILPKLYEHSEQRIYLLGRLRPGSTAQAAQAALAPVAQYLKRTYSKEDDAFTTPRVFPVTGLGEMKEDGMTPLLVFFVLLLGLVAIIVLIACVNISSLLIARAASRGHEIAVRLALGAARGRLMRQLLTESFLLALVSTAFGLVLHAGLDRVISQAQLPLPFPVKLDLSADWQLLAYALALTLITTIFCGLVPGRHATRLDLVSALKQKEAGQGSSRLRLSRFLISGEVAAAAVLLVMSFLFVRSLLYLSATDPGFDIEHTARIDVTSQETGSNPAHGLPVVPMLDRLRTVPGVEAASCASVVPLTMSSGNSVQLDAKNVTTTGEPLWVGPDYFTTLRIPLLGGREFQATDKPGAPVVAVINETLARRLFAHGSPLGARITIKESKEEQFAQIVGVVKDSKYVTLGEAPLPVVFFPYLQLGQPSSGIALLVRTEGAPTGFRRALHEAIQELDRTAFVQVRPMKENLATVLLPNRIGATLLGAIGLLALALATVGVYGVVSYSVTRRTAEIGIRLALGATRTGILRMVLRDAIVMIGRGALPGLFVGLALARILASLLPAGMSTSDPVTFLGVLVMLLGTGAAAAVLPATRAMRLDPMGALRYE